MMHSLLTDVELFLTDVEPFVTVDRTRPVGAPLMWAQSRHQATVLTISGEIDLSNSDYVQAFATRYVVLSGNPLVLDLSGVDFCAVQGISMLMFLDDTCRAAKVPWRLVSSRAVRRVLQLTACTTLPTASSVAEALRQIAALSHTRRRVTLPAALTTAPRHAAR